MSSRRPGICESHRRAQISTISLHASNGVPERPLAIAEYKVQRKRNGQEEASAGWQARLQAVSERREAGMVALTFVILHDVPHSVRRENHQPILVIKHPS